MLEQWKSLKELVKNGDNYEVSNFGNVRNSITKKVLRPYGDGNGYLRVCLAEKYTKKNHRVHRLVALAFLPNPDNKKVVNHKDGNKHHNNVTNIEWCTHSENTVHALDTGLKGVPVGKSLPQSKLTDSDVVCIRQLIKSGEPAKSIASRFNVGKDAIYSIKNGRTWKHVE
ncbi:putative HNH endonuclease [Bacillus phage PK16]|nr:putative HNH endonuclease [Bacillus phage PK16]AUM58967.1 DNA replication/modification protein [Bacillus phage BCP01]